ncbi:MAG: hypothetical protein AB1704_19930 [Pseudomonadota bacterium]
MGICKGERIGREDIFDDYAFENVMFRWDHHARTIYRKFYGKAESGPVHADNRLYNDALRFGDEISVEAYAAGKRATKIGNLPGSPRQSGRKFRIRQLLLAVRNQLRRE